MKPLRVVLPFLTWALSAAGPTCAQAPTEPSTPAASDPMLADAAQRLAAIGYYVPEGMRAEARSNKQVIADLDAHQDLFLPANAFVLQHELFRRLGLPAGRDAAALRQQAIAGMARGLSAYFDPIRKVFVLLPSATREISEAMAGSLLPLFTHELVHAHQDAREGGLQAFFGAADRTLDTSLARRCVIEGEAELVATVALRGAEAVAKMTDLSTVGTLDRLLGGAMTGLIYESGRRLAFARHRDSGLDAVRALWQQPPTSTEQILHPGKLGKDVPVAVVVPDVPGLTAAQSTTLGELMIVDLLGQLGRDRLAASLAAAGWDGDRLLLFERDKAVVALVWRSVWDRDEDAADFAARLAGEDRLVVCDGRVVDWITADDDTLRSEITAACAAARPQPVADAADAVSTATAETGLRAALETSRTEGGLWRHEALGVAVPMPDGWEVKEVNGVAMLIDRASAKTGFAMNLNVMAQPRGEIQSLEAMVALSREQFDRMELTVDAFEVTRRADTDIDVIVGEYHGRIGSSPRLHFLTLGWLRGEQQIWVTATATETLWRQHGGMLRELMAGVRISAP